VPTADYFRPLDDERAGRSESFPLEASTQAGKTAIGASGSTQPVASISPATANRPPPPSMVKVHIKSTAAGAGRYKGQIVTGKTTGTESAALSEPDGQQDLDRPDVLIDNLSESAEVTGGVGNAHKLLIGSWYLGLLIGVNPDGVTAVDIDAERCGATDTTNLNHHDANETAYTDKEESADGKVVTVAMVTRVVYNSAGDETFYAFVRDLAYECGRLKSVGAEQKITVTPTDACP
jgi:hypothetical protein